MTTLLSLVFLGGSGGHVATKNLDAIGVGGCLLVVSMQTCYVCYLFPSMGNKVI